MNTRKEVEQILNDLLNTSAEELANNGCKTYEPYVAIQSYTQDEEFHERKCCSACGRVWDVNNGSRSTHYGYWHREPNETCPDCGKVLHPIRNPSWTEGEKAYFKELENGFAVIRYNVSCSVPVDYDDVFAWLNTEPEMEIGVNNILVYDNDYGYLGIDGSSKIFAKNSNDLQSLIYNAEKAMYINEASLKLPSKAYLAVAKTVEEKRYNERQSKKKISKAQQIEEMRTKYVPKTFDFHNMPVETLLTRETGAIGNRRTYVCGCLKCNHVFTVETTERDAVKCPVCGTAGTIYNYTNSSRKDVMTLESTTLPENDLLIRKWDVQKVLDRNADGTYDIVEKIEERLRIYCGKKMCYYSVDRAGRASKIRSNSWSSHFYRADTIQDPEDLRIAITNSCLRYAGVAEAYGLGNSVYKQVCDLESTAYIEAWYKNPSIETLVKSNLTKAAKDAIRNPDNLIQDAKNPCDALAISKAVLKIATKLDLDLGQIREAQRLWTMDNGLTTEQFKEVVDSGLNIAIMANIKDQYGISLEDTMKYMQAAYDHQCIEKREALGIWADYLRMAKRLNIDLKDKSRRFPSSMKKEHDVAMFAYREIEERIDKEMFAEQAAINEQNFGNYSYKDYFIVIPKSPEEVVNEATQQKNCLRSYVTRIKNGDTTVCFIREKEEPDKSFVTVEVHEGKIVQLKGYCNSNPRDRKLMEFVQHWMAAKNITMHC